MKNLKKWNTKKKNSINYKVIYLILMNNCLILKNINKKDKNIQKQLYHLNNNLKMQWQERNKIAYKLIVKLKEI